MKTKYVKKADLWVTTTVTQSDKRDKNGKLIQRFDHKWYRSLKDLEAGIEYKII